MPREHITGNCNAWPTTINSLLEWLVCSDWYFFTSYVQYYCKLDSVDVAICLQLTQLYNCTTRRFTNCTICRL